MIPVLGFAVYKRFDLADRLLESIDYPVDDLIIVDNSGTQIWQPKKPELVDNMWIVRIPCGLGLVGAWNLIVKSQPWARYWLLVNDDAWFEPGALQTIHEKHQPTSIGHPQVNPKWSCIVLGEQVVDKVGLYDERFYPLYFDDNDYERRILAAGIEPYEIPAIVHHDNSASINHAKNDNSFARNHALYLRKTAENDLSWSWSLKTRRENSWD